jgi:hypothetical protein
LASSPLPEVYRERGTGRKLTKGLEIFTITKELIPSSMGNILCSVLNKKKYAKVLLMLLGTRGETLFKRETANQRGKKV